MNANASWLEDGSRESAESSGLQGIDCTITNGNIDLKNPEGLGKKILPLAKESGSQPLTNSQLDSLVSLFLVKTGFS